MNHVVISGTGLYTPPYSISNEELVNAFNRYVDRFNEAHKQAIDNGQTEALLHSSADFIEKASGIKSRYVMEKSGILDIDFLKPRNLERTTEETSIQCDMATAAAKEAMEMANISSREIGAVLVACSNMPRPYPSLAVEIQSALGINGYGYDLNVACASAAFAIQAARDAVQQRPSEAILIVNPEICTAHLNFADRDSHFIFGDACTAIIVQSEESCRSNQSYRVLDTKLKTLFSNNIRNNFGFLNNTTPETRDAPDKLFKQQGRKVFKEVVPMVAETLSSHIAENGIKPEELKRLWLHQANLSMNQLISKKVMGREIAASEAPIILDRFANTSSAGSIIAFHQHNSDLAKGDIGILSAFGAGYSVGSIILQRQS